MPILKLKFPFLFISTDANDWDSCRNVNGNNTDNNNIDNSTASDEILADEEERVSEIDVSIERRGPCVSFSLPHDLSVDLVNAVFLSKEHVESGVILAYEFPTIDEAEEWMESPELRVNFPERNGDVKRIEEEMNEFMIKYEENENKVKRRLVKDDEGFVYYK